MAAPAKRIAGRGPHFPYPRGLFQLTNSCRGLRCASRIVSSAASQAPNMSVVSPFNAIPGWARLGVILLGTSLSVRLC